MGFGTEFLSSLLSYYRSVDLYLYDEFFLIALIYGDDISVFLF